MSVTKYTITRERLARSPLATGPGFAWKYLYAVKCGGTVIGRGFDRLDSTESFIRRRASIAGGPYYIEKEWK